MVAGSSGVVQFVFAFHASGDGGDFVGCGCKTTGKTSKQVAWPGGGVRESFSRGQERQTLFVGIRADGVSHGGNFWVVAHLSCVEWQPQQLCCGTLSGTVQDVGLTELSVGDPQLHTWARPGALTVVHFTDDPGWSHARVWTWLVVNRSGDICGFAMYTPGGDEYVETLTNCSLYAPITRQGSTFPYPWWRRGTISGGDL